MLSKFDHIVFSDGSALGNPGPGGWGTVIVTNKKYVCELGGNEKHTTNNRMELTAVKEALVRLQEEAGSALICSDSKYVINAVTVWIHGWKQNNWMTASKTPVLNKDIIHEIDKLLEGYSHKGQIEFRYVPGHVGVLGNERCDAIATTFAAGQVPELFDGSFDDYSIDILNITIDEAAAEKKERSKSSSTKATGKAYSYLSLVEGKAMRHNTWPECEKRVKGKSGVKFKKAMSAPEEAEILKGWGVSL